MTDLDPIMAELGVGMQRAQSGDRVVQVRRAGLTLAIELAVTGILHCERPVDVAGLVQPGNRHV